MKIFIGSRRSGKTTELIKEAARTKALIVAPNVAIAENIFKLSKQLGYAIQRPISYSHLKSTLGAYRNTNILIDNADLLLEYLIANETHGSSRLSGFSMTSNDVTSNTELIDLDAITPAPEPFTFKVNGVIRELPYDVYKIEIKNKLWNNRRSIIIPINEFLVLFGNPYPDKNAHAGSRTHYLLQRIDHSDSWTAMYDNQAFNKKMMITENDEFCSVKW